MFVGWNTRCCDALVLDVLRPERDNCGINEGVRHIIDPNGQMMLLEGAHLRGPRGPGTADRLISLRRLVMCDPSVRRLKRAVAEGL